MKCVVLQSLNRRPSMSLNVRKFQEGLRIVAVESIFTVVPPPRAM